MIIHFSGSQKDKFQEAYRKLGELRYEVFVARRKWTLPARNNIEVDQYDNCWAEYFYGVSRDGSIYSHVRLTPTLHSSLLADYFPHLVAMGDAPRAPDIYEATRYIVTPSVKTATAKRRAKAELLEAAMLWAKENGVTQLQTVIDTHGLSSFLELSNQVQPLGTSHAYGGGPETPGGGEALAIRCPVNDQVIQNIRDYGGLEGGNDVRDTHDHYGELESHKSLSYH